MSKNAVSTCRIIYRYIITSILTYVHGSSRKLYNTYVLPYRSNKTTTVQHFWLPPRCTTRTSLSWVVMQRMFVVVCRHFCPIFKAVPKHRETTIYMWATTQKRKRHKENYTRKATRQKKAIPPTVHLLCPTSQNLLYEHCKKSASLIIAQKKGVNFWQVRIVAMSCLSVCPRLSEREI